jgi:hypothetical protein
MTEPNCTVTVTPPDYSNPLALDALVRLLTGEGVSDFVREVQQNLGGQYDFLYEEETP